MESLPSRSCHCGRRQQWRPKRIFANADDASRVDPNANVYWCELHGGFHIGHYWKTCTGMNIWACSAVGSAPPRQGGGPRFEPGQVHGWEASRQVRTRWGWRLKVCSRPSSGPSSGNPFDSAPSGRVLA